MLGEIINKNITSGHNRSRMPTSENSLVPTGGRRPLVGSSEFSRVGIQAPVMPTSYVFALLYLAYDNPIS